MRGGHSSDSVARRRWAQTHGWARGRAAELYGFEAELRGRAESSFGRLKLIDHDVTMLPAADSILTSAGSLVFALPQPALPALHFRASFQLRMGRGAGADGVSFS